MDEGLIMGCCVVVLVMSLIGLGYVGLYENIIQPEIETCFESCVFGEHNKPLEFECKSLCVDTFASCGATT